MSTKYPLYPDDRSNQFGSANDLDANGGVFDSYQNENDRYHPPLPYVQEPQPVQAAVPFAAAKDDVIAPSDEPQVAAGNILNDEEAVTSQVQNAPVVRNEQPYQNEPIADAPRTYSTSAVPAQNARPKKGIAPKWIALFSLLFVTVATLGVFLYTNTHAIFGELFGRHEIVSSYTTVLDLSGSDYSDYSQLSKLKALETVDLTNTPVRDLSVLYGLGSLKRVILADRTLSASDCIAFYGHVPGSHLTCKVDINGQIYDSETAQLTVENMDGDSQKLLASLNSLIRLDLTGCEVSEDTLSSLSEALPDCMIIARVQLNGKEYRTDAASVVLSGEITEKDVELLHYFKNLKTMDVRNCTSTDLVDKIISAHPDVKLNNPIVLLGHNVGTEDEFVDLRGSKYTFKEVKAALDEALPRMKSLRKIDMCGCGLSNYEMEQLCKAYPDIKFVWMIHFVKWSVRTDAVAFSALNSEGKSTYTQDDYAPLFKYCTDMVALDLGHSRITDISAISSMKHLRAVILMDNKITDISVFAELKDLEFIEMNATNKVKSIEPLRKLQNLRFINLWGSVGLTDLSPLYEHEKLEIAIFERTIAKEEQARFKESNPNCAAFFKVDSNKVSTNEAWRMNPYRRRLKERVFRNLEKDIFKNWMYVVGFDEETGEYILDYSTNQYKYR